LLNSSEKILKLSIADRFELASSQRGFAATTASVRSGEEARLSSILGSVIADCSVPL